MNQKYIQFAKDRYAKYYKSNGIKWNQMLNSDKFANEWIIYKNKDKTKETVKQNVTKASVKVKRGQVNLGEEVGDLRNLPIVSTNFISMRQQFIDFYFTESFLKNLSKNGYMFPNRMIEKSTLDVIQNYINMGTKNVESYSPYYELFVNNIKLNLNVYPNRKISDIYGSRRAWQFIDKYYSGFPFVNSSNADVDLFFINHNSQYDIYNNIFAYGEYSIQFTNPTRMLLLTSFNLVSENSIEGFFKNMNYDIFVKRMEELISNPDRQVVSKVFSFLRTGVTPSIVEDNASYNFNTVQSMLNERVLKYYVLSDGSDIEIGDYVRYAPRNKEPIISKVVALLQNGRVRIVNSSVKGGTQEPVINNVNKISFDSNDEHIVEKEIKLIDIQTNDTPLELWSRYIDESGEEDDISNIAVSIEKPKMEIFDSYLATFSSVFNIRNVEKLKYVAETGQNLYLIQFN